MAEETSKKRPAKPFRGKEDGKPFTKENQPSSEAKKAGWERVRAKKLLTQAILKRLGVLEGDMEAPRFNTYVDKLIANAEAGNTEAMKQVRQSIEDDTQRIDLTTNGESLKGMVKWGDKEIPV